MLALPRRRHNMPDLARDMRHIRTLTGQARANTYASFPGMVAAGTSLQTALAEPICGAVGVGAQIRTSQKSAISVILWQTVVHERQSSSCALCRAKTRTLALSWCFLRSLGCSPVLADQALDGLSALDPGGHVDRLAGIVQRGSLCPRLVGPVIVVVLGVLGQDLPEVPFAIDQQMAGALASQCPRISLREGVRPG